ncbi:MAG: hypothetical protein RL646_397 [Verrucomicrobiota bacterium]|jgi:protein TonB
MTRPALDCLGTPPDARPVRAARRHAVTWSAVAALHLAAAAAVIGGRPSVPAEPVREGGLLLVSVFEPDPIAPAGEAPAGSVVGAGASLPPPVEPPASVAVVAPAPSVRLAPVAEPERSVSSAVSPAVIAPAPVVVAPRAPVLIPPSFVVREEPSYPARARRAGAEGRVVVRVAISAEGTVTALTVQESSGSALLDEAALSAARASRFSPASRDGVAEPSEAVAAYRFELR